MNSSISASDRHDPADAAARLAWRRWLAVFCGAFFGVAALLYTLLVLIDPYDTARFPTFGIVGISDNSPRTADASRGRDPHFNATVIGNSTGQLVDPYRLSRETGLRFNQLTIPAVGPREQLAIMRWVVSHHPTYGAFVIITDMLWCSPDPNLPPQYPFPFWLYGDDLTYLANVLKSKSLDRAVWRIQIALGMRQVADRVGYSDYLTDKNVAFVPEPPGLPADESDAQWRPGLPWIDQLRAFLASLPQSTRIVLAMPPVYFTLLPRPGGRQAAIVDACKAALATAVPDRPHSGFLDFRVDTERAHDVTDFVDPIHYRDKLARHMEEGIIALLRSGDTAVVQSRLDARSH